MKKEDLDYVLVPLGLAAMAGYHAWLLFQVRRRPTTTVIGVNAINRRIWVRHVMEVWARSINISVPSLFLSGLARLLYCNCIHKSDRARMNNAAIVFLILFFYSDRTIKARCQELNVLAKNLISEGNLQCVLI
jgi:hypothetical protein